MQIDEITFNALTNILVQYCKMPRRVIGNSTKWRALTLIDRLGNHVPAGCGKSFNKATIMSNSSVI